MLNWGSHGRVLATLHCLTQYLATTKMATVRYTVVTAEPAGQHGEDEEQDGYTLELVEHDKDGGVASVGLMELEHGGRAAPTIPPFFGSCRCACVLLCWLANIVCYADRINISVAIISMSEEMGWRESEEGYVLSAFFYGYMITQILGGK